MEFFKPNLLIDFMRHRRVYMTVSFVLVTASLVALFFPGPNFGTDFVGGTEVQIQFQGAVSSAELRQELERLGYQRPDVVAVVERPNEYIIRIGEYSTITEAQTTQIVERLTEAIEGIDNVSLDADISIPEGGDRIRIDVDGPIDENVLRNALAEIEVAIVEGESGIRLADAGEHRYEVALSHVSTLMVQQLSERFGEGGEPVVHREERVGPRAGQQLRQAAINSLLYTLAFIMGYVALRFDLRFAPGGVVAMAHDAIITLGVFILLQKEFNLTIVAALLTIVGYSINDTIVVYDRIRENMGRYRDKSLYDIINISTSQMLSRTIVTSGTTLLSVSAFFIWGTSVIRDISFALFIGILIGTYSSIYVAAPLTEWMDRRFFRRAKKRARAARRRRRA